MLNDQSESKFKPKGAIAFFVLLLISCAALWFSLYYIMLQKH